MGLLTADVMQDLINFRKATNMPYDITIINNNIYLRFHCGAMFEPTALKKGIVEEKTFKKYYDIVNFIDTLSKELINLIEETEI